METDRSLIYQLLKEILFCFARLDYLREYFNGELIQLLYDDCHDTEQMVLTCSFKEIINGIKNPSDLSLNLELFLQRYILIFKDQIFSEQNKSNLCIGFVLNIIEEFHKEQNFESNQNFILEEQPFSVQTQKDGMLGKFIEFLEQTETAGISKILYGTNVIVKECQICHSITYKYEIQKTLNFDIDEIITFKKLQNNNNNIDKISLNDCFNYYFYPKKQNNDFICNNQNCNGKCNNETKLISWTSDIMIITLKRQSFEKEEKDIEIKTNINVINYMDKDSLNNLTKFNGQKMNYIYELKAMIYLDKNDYILCLKITNKKWKYYFDGIPSEECEDILEKLDKIKQFQPVLLFYEYQDIPKSENKNNKKKNKENMINQLEEILIIILKNIKLLIVKRII